MNRIFTDRLLLQSRCRRAALAIMALMLVCFNGCIKAGPDFAIPETGFKAPGAFVNESAGVQAQEKKAFKDDQWWKSLGDEKLNVLVEEAASANLDVRKAAASVLELQAALKSARADRFPSLSLKADASRQEQTVTKSNLVFNKGKLGYESYDDAVTTDSFSLMAAAGFEPDLWGRLARSEEAARASLLAVEENARAVLRTVIAATVNSYLDAEALQRRIRITEKSIEGYKRNLELVRLRYEGGLTSVLDLRQARRALAQAEAGLPSLKMQLGIQLNSLAILLGRYPDMAPPSTPSDNYFETKNLEEIPAGLPSELLLRRPDIRSAQASLKAANARIGAARAARFPSLNLTGSAGYVSDELGLLIQPESALWNVAAGLTAPVFNAGKLKAAEDSARAAYEQQAVSWAQAVLEAFREVENALLSRVQLRERRERLMEYVKEAGATLEVAENRYKRGLVDYISVLDARQAAFSSEHELVAAELAILQNRVALHKALGGGWGLIGNAAVSEASKGVE